MATKQLTCKEPGCEQQKHGRGMCRAHYHQWRKTNAVTIPCTEDGCDKPAQGRGLCGTHYTYWHRAQKRHLALCIECGDSFMASRPNTTTCSPTCKARLGQRVTALLLRRSTNLVKYTRPRVWLGTETTGRTWVAGRCSWCNDYFIAKQGVVYCADRCSRRAREHRRYLRYGVFSVTDRLRTEIYERDNYVCQLCFTEVDASLAYMESMSATLDHIECQSWSLIADHRASNLRLAHRYCNSVRGNRE